MFDEQPDGDPHGECAAEIQRLTEQCAVLEASNRIRGDELARLRDEVEDWKQGSAAEARLGDEARAELARLREQEPVAWINYPARVSGGKMVGHGPAELSFKRLAYGFDWSKSVPLVASKPAAQPVQRLSDGRIDEITRDKFGTKLLGVMIAMHREYARSIEAALQPQGWVLVPMEPTVEMRRAAAPWIAHYNMMRAGDKTNALTDAYRAMIAAAPSAGGAA